MEKRETVEGERRGWKGEETWDETDHIAPRAGMRLHRGFHL